MLKFESNSFTVGSQLAGDHANLYFRQINKNAGASSALASLLFFLKIHRSSDHAHFNCAISGVDFKPGRICLLRGAFGIYTSLYCITKGILLNYLTDPNFGIIWCDINLKVLSIRAGSSSLIHSYYSQITITE